MPKMKKLIDAYLTQVLPADARASWRVQGYGRGWLLEARTTENWMVFRFQHPGELLKDRFHAAVHEQLKAETQRGTPGYALVQNMKAFRRVPLDAKARARKRIRYGERKQREETAAGLLRAQIRAKLGEVKNE